MARNKPQGKDIKTETSKSLDKLFYQYTHLPLGRKKVICPYWINNLKLGIFGPYGGKGTPEEIVQATEDEAKKANLDLEKMTKEEITAFMKRKKIGIDCSGFVFWMLDVLDKEKGGNGIADDIPNSVGKFLPSRANVAMLTNEKVICSIRIKEVKVGDMIRLDKGRHVAIVMRVVRELGDIGEVKEIEYAHSSSRTKTSGVHNAKIKIIDQNKGLEEQQWYELASENKSYGKIYLLSGIGDGIKRLKSWL